ncbi:hypothetical protein LCGC14_1080920 [marine sediment metagenome]|uniref:Uncharacterized protein n=1 Tax=marine sediment metagenome TaxID=412755 RepID=A0A0F9QL48_9ZZZZ
MGITKKTTPTRGDIYFLHKDVFDGFVDRILVAYSDENIIGVYEELRFLRVWLDALNGELSCFSQE